MQGRSADIATDANPGISTKDLDVSRFSADHLRRLYLAVHRRGHDGKKPGGFRRLTTTALRLKLARSILPPPLEQHVGVEPVTQRQLCDGYFRFAGFCSQSALEPNRVIGPASPAPSDNFACVQNGPHYLFDGHHFLSLSHYSPDGLRTTLTRQPRCRSSSRVGSCWPPGCAPSGTPASHGCCTGCPDRNARSPANWDCAARPPSARH